MSMRVLALAPLALLLAVILGFLSLLTRGEEAALVDPIVGTAFPEMALAPLEGYAHFDPSQGAPAGPALVNIWASWCAPCIVEHPLLTAMAEEGVTIYGIDYKERQAGAGEAFLQRLGNPFTSVGADPRGRMGLELGVTGVPETFVIDAEGVIVARWAGPLDERTIDRVIRPALREASR